MISSPSAQIVNAVAESIIVTSSHGDPVPAYGPTMGVATAIIALGIVITTMFGPEKKGRHFELIGPAGSAQLPEKKDVEDGLSPQATKTEADHMELAGKR